MVLQTIITSTQMLQKPQIKPVKPVKPLHTLKTTAFIKSPPTPSYTLQKLSPYSKPYTSHSPLSTKKFSS